jgi:predicted Rossmann fold nucleotide-binding protein DprA/Smf involved in DNA uptake
MRLAIIGSRNCPEINISSYLDSLPEAIISGGAKGADTYAREFAQEHGIEIIEFLPDYKRYGRGAPIVRNKLIVENCDELIAFWDGESKGTKFTIDYAMKIGKKVRIIEI